MKNGCSLWRVIAQTLFMGGVSLSALFSVGCTSGPSAARIAPTSGVSRDSALSLAQHAAAAVGGKVFTVSATGSMKPTLDESSVVTVESIAFDALRKGDIIVYRSTLGIPIIHRLYEQVGNRWLVLGDNNPAVDSEAVTAENLVGRVCAIFYTSPGTPGTFSTAMAAR